MNDPNLKFKFKLPVKSSPSENWYPWSHIHQKTPEIYSNYRFVRIPRWNLLSQLPSILNPDPNHKAENWNKSYQFDLQVISDSTIYHNWDFWIGFSRLVNFHSKKYKYSSLSSVWNLENHERTRFFQIFAQEVL